ncbi:MAG: hypothetical protein L0Z62_10855 [Gemmataceae bacterium]|nr:hypothetical protein [Gemmataceae bacterium]
MAMKNNPPRPQSAPQEPSRPRPAHEVRLGRIKATIWSNTSETGTWYNVTLSRTYREGDEWKSSASFGRDDLLVVAKVADLAHSWICQQLQGQAGNAKAGVEEEIPF